MIIPPSLALGNSSEGALLFNYALKLWRERGDEYSVAWALMELSSANGASLHPQESIRQAREALEIYERLGATEERASCLCTLAKVLRGVGQLDAAEDAVVESIRLLSPGEDQESSIFLCLRVLGDIYCDKGQTEEALRQYEEALRIATALGSSICLSIAHYVLAEFFTFMTAGDKLDEAQVHIVQTKSYLSVFDHPSFLGRATLLHAWIHCRQCRIEDAMSEALHAREILEGHGTSLEDIDSCNVLLEALEVVRGLQGTSQRPEERA
ncbi:hypothetical protein BJ322DRAFT_1022212 [Thelephora terrestris]|uniref:MalT-like TPR region domain-containing protein n=1 Tax=Thelephora terrestris TaxID=56493 RepID=A0A9P6L4Z8_9AGAM|nr:hypothetical protein BJ322DRAFT_1022212 [Thelephora terrestris]